MNGDIPAFDRSTESSPLPTLHQMNALVAFRPLLYAQGFQPILPPGTLQEHTPAPYPNYHPTVLAFYRLASEEVWCDHDYVPQTAHAMLEDADFVRRASLAQVRTMLTFCVRGERFFYGHWAAMIERGLILRLLDRLEVIAAGG
ncbi:MAG: hypothetical protein HPY76_03990 [Anaerolineae bacterium]|nr:hypothetical protein [Anaerolineae bacterium]